VLESLPGRAVGKISWRRLEGGRMRDWGCNPGLKCETWGTRTVSGLLSQVTTTPTTKTCRRGPRHAGPGAPGEIGAVTQVSNNPGLKCETWGTRTVSGLLSLVSTTPTTKTCRRGPRHAGPEAPGESRDVTQVSNARPGAPGLFLDCSPRSRPPQRRRPAVPPRHARPGHPDAWG
jgi:hypothetical protein